MPSSSSSSYYYQSTTDHHHQHHNNNNSKRAPFSFHCRICYERLNLTDRAPVVLPCGHTYICAQCSAKLTKCMECRTRLVPMIVKPKPPPPLINNYHGTRRTNHPTSSHNSRSVQVQLPVPTTHDELAQAIQASNAAPLMPRNVVLMALLEAAAQEGGGGGASTSNSGDTMASSSNNDHNAMNDSGYESGDDDALVLDGIRTLTAMYGTYVVKQKQGLVVYANATTSHAVVPAIRKDDDANSILTITTTTTSTSTSTSRKDPPPPALNNNNNNNNGPTKLQAVKKMRKDRRRKQQEQRRQQQQQQLIAEDEHVDEETKQQHRFPLLQHLPSTKRFQQQQQPVVQRRLAFGDTVQVVSFHDNVAKLASNQGYIRVDHEDELVKIGEPEDDACRMEGLICSILEEKKLCKARISHLNKWEKQLQTDLRRHVKKQAEQERLERHQARQQELLHERTMSQHDGTIVAHAKQYDGEEHPTNMEVLLSHPAAATSPPPPQLLELSPTSSPETPAPARRRMEHPQPQYLDHQYHAHPDHAPPPQDPDYLQEARRAGRNMGTAAANNTMTSSQDYHPRKQPTPKEPAPSSFPWDEDFLARGCDLFFCATMPLCVGATASAAQPPPTPPPPVRHSHSLLAADAAAGPARYTFDSTSYHQQPPPPTLTRSTSVESGGDDTTVVSCNDNSTVTSVDFATGLSGHWGMSSARARAHAPRKTNFRMMSQHDGIAHIRRKQRQEQRTQQQQQQPSFYHNGDCGSTCGSSSKASIATF